MAPSRVVTVLLALEPVIATIGASASRANNSMSPTTLTPASMAALIAGVAKAIPGLTINSPALLNNAASSSPKCRSAMGAKRLSLSSPGGLARVSQTANGKSRPARYRATDRPVAPSPTMIRCLSVVISDTLFSSTQLERGQTDQHQYHGNDPETHDDPRLGPTLQFEMVVNGRHTEHPATSQLERGHLDDYRQGLDHKDAAHDEQHDLLTDDHCDHAQRRTQGQCAHIAHEYLGRIGVEPEETEAGTNQRAAEDQQLARALHIGNQQILGELEVTRQVGKDAQRAAHHHRRQNCQAIQPIGQVDGIAGANDDEIGQYHEEDAQLELEVLEERYDQGGFQRGFRRQVQHHRRHQAEYRLPEILPAR